MLLSYWNGLKHVKHAVANKGNHHVDVKTPSGQNLCECCEINSKLIQNMERVQTECLFSFKAYNVQTPLFSTH